MRIAIIGRTEILYNTVLQLMANDHTVTSILTAKEAPEYTRTVNDFQALSSHHNLPFATGSKILDHFEFLKSSHADVAVSVNYTGIIPDEIIKLFPLGILNAHGGDLPRYRGNACQAWAILNGETEIGLCIHKMVGGELDSGDIIAREYLPINSRTKVTDVWNWMTHRTPELFTRALAELSKNPSFYLEQQSASPVDALRCYPRLPEDGRIQWSLPSDDILRLINASNKPYPGAYCTFKNAKLIIWDAEVADNSESFCAMPGQVTFIGADYVEVACGNHTKLRLLEIETNDTPPIKPSTIIHSIRSRLY